MVCLGFGKYNDKLNIYVSNSMRQIMNVELIGDVKYEFLSGVL